MIVTAGQSQKSSLVPVEKRTECAEKAVAPLLEGRRASVESAALRQDLGHDSVLSNVTLPGLPLFVGWTKSQVGVRQSTIENKRDIFEETSFQSSSRRRGG